MGIFDFLTGTKRPAAGVAPKPAAEVRAALLAVNRDTAPWIVREGAAEKVDGIKQVFKILMRLDAGAHEVRAVDQEFSVEWEAGVPRLSGVAQAFRGQKTEFAFGTAASLFTEAGPGGLTYRYRFVSNELKAPLQEAATGAGWTWRGVAFGKL
jgi:hypothetical protein